MPNVEIWRGAKVRLWRDPAGIHDLIRAGGDAYLQRRPMLPGRQDSGNQSQFEGWLGEAPVVSSCLKSLLEMQILIGFLVVIGGALTTIQSGFNGALNKALEAPVLTGLVIAAGNLIVYGAAYAFVGLHWPNSERVNQVPWWAWFGGVLVLLSQKASVCGRREAGSISD